MTQTTGPGRTVALLLMAGGAIGGLAAQWKHGPGPTPSGDFGHFIWVGLGMAVFFAGFLLALAVSGRRRLAGILAGVYLLFAMVGAVLGGPTAALLPFVLAAFGGYMVWPFLILAGGVAAMAMGSPARA